MKRVWFFPLSASETACLHTQFDAFKFLAAYQYKDQQCHKGKRQANYEGEKKRRKKKLLPDKIKLHSQITRVFL